MNNAITLFSQKTIKVCVITFAYYIPSHDMVVSVLMEIRFDKAGSVRSRMLEVLPLQIFVAGVAVDEDVV